MKKYKVAEIYSLIFIIVLLCNSCNERTPKSNVVKYIGTWKLYNTIKLKFDTAEILKSSDSIFNYHPYGVDSSFLKLDKKGNLVDLEDSSFILRYNNKTDQLIVKSIINGEDLYANRIK